MRSVYLSSNDLERHIPRSRYNVRQIVTAVAATLLAVLVLIPGALLGAANQQVKSAPTAQAFDWGQWVMCDVFPDPGPMIYQMTQTSDLQFMLRSKSAISTGADEVDSGLNALLSFGNGSSYSDVNSLIVGYEVDEAKAASKKDMVTDPDKEGKDQYNKGEQISPFDRFGVAGLKFTGYAGEWRHIVTDACNPESSTADPNAGEFYEDRLVPRSTWTDIANSNDIRTKQFQGGVAGIASHYMISISNTLANWLFVVTKAIVVATIALISFAFSDIAGALGVNDFVAGVFDALFSGLFLPLIVLVIAIVGFRLVYVGMIQRRTRQGLTDVLRAVLMFFLAFAVAQNSALVVQLPNYIAVQIQALVLSAADGSVSSGGGLCTSSISSVEKSIIKKTGGEPQSLLDEAARNVSSSVGCQFWQMFLFEPWAQGQFGAGWNELWATGHIPGWAKGGSDLGNNNDEAVGDAAVPIGGGKSLHNWALFQLSTQTNAHATFDKPGETARYSNGMNTDWWRVVDALADYQETTEYIEVNDGNGGTERVEYSTPNFAKIDVSPHWETWVGNNPGGRIWSAFSSILIAAVGVLGPLLFSFMSVVYSLWLDDSYVSHAAYAAAWSMAGFGWSVFMGWLELVVNTMMKRIGYGLLLTLSIMLSTMAIGFISSHGYHVGIMAMAVFLFVLFKFRNQLLDALASFRFAGANLASTAKRVSERVMLPAKIAGEAGSRTSLGAISGAIGSKVAGGSAAAGAWAGAKQGARDVSVKHSNNPYMRAIARSYDAARHRSDASDDNPLTRGGIGQQNCAKCGIALYNDPANLVEGEGANRTIRFNGGRDSAGNIYCSECFLMYETELNLFPYATRISDDDKPATLSQRATFTKEAAALASAYQNTAESERAQSSMSNHWNQVLLEEATSGRSRDGEKLSIEQRQFRAIEAMTSFEYDIAAWQARRVDQLDGRLPEHMYGRGDGQDVEGLVIPIPDEVARYADMDLLRDAYVHQEFAVVRTELTKAMMLYLFDETNEPIFTQEVSELVSVVERRYQETIAEKNRKQERK